MATAEQQERPSSPDLCACCGKECSAYEADTEYCLGRKEWSCSADCREHWHTWCGESYDCGDLCYCSEGKIESPDGQGGPYPHQPPHKSKMENCCAECNCDISGEHTTIYCLMNDEGDEMTVCDDCWDSGKKEFQAEGWYDQNADSDEEEESDDDSICTTVCTVCKECIASKTVGSLTVRAVICGADGVERPVCIDCA